MASHVAKELLAEVQIPVGQLIRQLTQMLQIRIEAGVICPVERFECLPQYIAEVRRHLFRPGVLNSGRIQ